MSDDWFSRIRPVWLVGGGAALAVLGLCALLSLCAAVGLVWFTTQTSTNTSRATQVAIQTQNEQTATALPAPSLTPLPAIAGPAAPTPLLTAPATASSSLTPDQAVRSYYQLVSQKRYDLTWPLLTDAFKQKFNCCAPTYNYSGYTSWWNSVSTVELGDVHTVSQSGDRAVVYAQLYYHMNTGERSSVDRQPYIALVYDAATGAWRFDDKRARP